MKQMEASFKQVDVLPMVKHYMSSLNLFSLFKKYVPSPTDILAEHAESLCVLTANIICDNKPLYKVQEWLSKYSDGLVDDPVNAKLFNDDRFGRDLSALFKADRQSLMTELSSNAIKVHKLMTDEVHNDSTSVTFIGKYENPDPEAVKLMHGHNKDFRPDCKQIVFGLNVTSDGHVPLSFSLYDGNTNDDVTHIPNWNGLRSLLAKEDFIYIADCKLCSDENLSHIAQNNGFFITIVPKGRTEVKEFINYLKTNDVQWEDALEIESSRKKGEINKYKTYEFAKTKKGFRIIWVHSSFKEHDDKRKREEKIKKAQAALEELSPKLNRYRLKTKEQITKAIDKIRKGIGDLIDIKVVTERKQITVKISPVTHDSKGVFKNKWEFKYKVEWKLNHKAIRDASRSDGIFPLITNTELEAAEVLRKYKDQAFLEKRMYTQKSILEVAPVFLKKEKRIEAMLFLYFIALMVVSLIERRIRMNMEQQNVKKLPILPQNMNTKRPTWNNIRYFFRNVHLAQVMKNNIPIQTTLKGLSHLHQKINQLLEVPSFAYEIFKDQWWSFKGT